MENQPLTQPKITVDVILKQPSSLVAARYDVDVVETWETTMGEPMLLLKVKHKLYYTVVATFKLDLVEKFYVRDCTHRGNM